jgi:hypothetical protein
MDLDSLRRAARERFKEITANNPTPDFAPAGPLTADVQALSLASLSSSLGIPSLDDDIYQVGFQLYRRRPIC